MYRKLDRNEVLLVPSGAVVFQPDLSRAGSRTGRNMLPMMVALLTNFRADGHNVKQNAQQ